MVFQAVGPYIQALFPGRLAEMYPCLLLGDGAHEQISALRGTEPVFRQLLRHLRALEEGALEWAEGRMIMCAVASSYLVLGNTRS